MDMVVLQCRPPPGGCLRGARVGECFCEYHYVPWLARYLERPRGIHARISPTFAIKVEVLLVGTGYHRKATVTRVIGREHGDHVYHWRSYLTRAHRVLLRRQAVMPPTGFTTFIFRDGPGIDELRFAHEFLEVGEDSGVCDELVKNGVEPRKPVQANLMLCIRVLDEMLGRDDGQPIRPTLVMVHGFILDHSLIQLVNNLAINGAPQNQEALNIEKEFLFIGYFIHFESRQLINVNVIDRVGTDSTDMIRLSSFFGQVSSSGLLQGIAAGLQSYSHRPQVIHQAWPLVAGRMPQMAPHALSRVQFLGNHIPLCLPCRDHRVICPVIDPTAQRFTCFCRARVVR